MNRRNKAADESGVSLILVLVALTVFGLLVPVLGQFGSVNGVSGYIVKGQRFDRYAAENGMNAAIAYAQGRRTVGRAHVPCPDITSTMTASTAFKRDVTVKCQGYAPSGIPEGSVDTPAYAVLGLNPSRHSIDVDAAPTDWLKTSGAWWANGDSGDTSADIHGIQIDATDDLFGATGNCHPTNGAHIFAAPRYCDSGVTVEDPALTNPSYASSLASLTGVHADPVLDCNSIQGNGVLALEPGIHWDADFLSEVARGRCNNHRDVVIWLKPGAHYFDFDFYDPSSDAEWAIGNSGSHSVVVVGGAPKGWDPGSGQDQVAAARAAVTQDNAATAAGACDLGANGVELVLGSKSRVIVDSPARVELCPLRTDSSGQHLAISGPRTGSEGPTFDVPVETPHEAVPIPANGFTWPPALPAPPAPNPLAAQECNPRQNCDPALFQEGELRGRRGRTGTVSMLVANQIPENTKIRTIHLDVRHREPVSDNGDGDRRDQIDGLSAVINRLGVVANCDRIDPSENWTTDSVTCTLDRPIPAPNPADVPDLEVALTFTTNGNDNNSATEQLDYVAIRANVTRAGIRAEQCPDSRCRAVDIDNGGGNGAAFVWGTVYLPTADVHEDFGGATSFKLARGVIADSVILEGLSSSTDFIPVSLPNGGIYSTRTVAFEARIGTKTKLRARVEFADPVKWPDVPAKVLSWDTHP